LRIERVLPNTGRLVELGTGAVHEVTSASERRRSVANANGLRRHPRAVVDHAPSDAMEGGGATRVRAGSPLLRRRGARSIPVPVPAEFERDVARVRQAVSELRRCARCVLPETMPFIRFDAAGVCTYCRNSRPTTLYPLERLLEVLEPHRRRCGLGEGEPEVLVGLSGGRDSSYALHVIKNQLNLNPAAFTYDWGMVTDLARRNISRMCGRLGVEHILVSADIAVKRANIRRNVLAWLRRPNLGTIPLFMAGDKQYFYHASRIRRRMGIGITMLGENLLEKTDFKVGYCNVPPDSGRDGDRAYVLSRFDKVRLALFYAREFLRNPAYLNRSLLDSFTGYVSYYLIPRDYLNIYRYVQWDERQIESTLIGDYGWETAPDTSSTWRIGDGTAAFYNYIYYMVSGFSEIDTLRSNQIREGVLTRERAMELCETENVPRFESIRNYCQLIDVDFELAVRTINAIPKRFPASGCQAPGMKA
jgi:glutamine---fructose-6-phosphate transaminase (isomerizing)